jgi:hypothetical protein
MLPAIVIAVHSFMPDAKITSAQVKGNVAVVSFSHGKIEGVDRSGKLLLRHYVFGWQAVSMAGSKEAFNAADLHDTGESADVESIRRKMADKYHSHEIIGPVHVVRDYAIANWWGIGGGQALFRKVGSAWTVVTAGGGALGMSDLRRYGVPGDVASEILHAEAQR